MTYDVTCKFTGRLGNNLFQTASCAAYARRYGLRWAIPRYDHSQIGEFGLPVTEEFADPFVYKEPGFGYSEIPFQGHRQVQLEGYFQSQKYFEDQADFIRSIFWLPNTPRSDSISVHVRRGDFLNYGTAFRTLSPAYYAEAMAKFVERGRTHFTVFSDDMAWCLAHLPHCHSKAKFHFEEEPNVRMALAKMSACAGHILANSTFSWWAAWLNPYPLAVICPSNRHWFGDAYSGADTSSIYPPSWIQLQTP